METRTVIRRVLSATNFVVEPKQGRYNFPQNLFGAGVYAMFEETWIARSKRGNIVRVMFGRNMYHGAQDDHRIFVGIKVYFPDHREHSVCVLPHDSAFKALNTLTEALEPILNDDNGTE